MSSLLHDDFDDLDDLYDRSSADKIIDLRRVFGPRRPGRQARNPPPIGVGEITSSARRDTGALEVIARLRQRGQRGRPAGLAWYTPTGLVRYAVVRPDQSRILWQGNLGRIPGLAAMSTSQREAAIRQLITQRTGQRFRNLRPGHKGPDLVPLFDAFDGYDTATAVAAAVEDEVLDELARSPGAGLALAW